MKPSQLVESQGLKILERPGPENSKAVLCLLHGYGASCEDLAPLADYPLFDPAISWVFPDGPQTVPIGPGMVGRAWFPLDPQRLQETMLTGKPMDLSASEPPGALEISATLAGYFKRLKERFETVFVGGFSQGSMVCLEAVLSQPWVPDGILLLSSNLVSKSRWEKLAKEHAALNIFQSHGLQDPVLGYAGAEQLKDVLVEAGHHVEFHSFQGGHEIPLPVLQAAATFINKDQEIKK